MDASAHSTALARWYERIKRDLPWRRTRDPYAIWISEIMLQQTRVAAVIPYYERFLARFPNAAALAAAPEERGADAVERPRLLFARPQSAESRAPDRRNAAHFREPMTKFAKLAGVGDYTAAAVASIAFGLPHAVVDGNVRRVIARITNGKERGARKSPICCSIAGIRRDRIRR